MNIRNIPDAANATPAQSSGSDATDNDQIISHLRQEVAELRQEVARLGGGAAANQAKDQLLMTLGQDLRDPLAPIRTSVALLGRAGAGDPVVAQASAVIERQVGRMTRIIDDLLDTSRLAQGHISLAREVTDLAWLVETVAAAHLPTMAEAGVHLEVTVPVLPVRVAADPARLGQALDRLLDNAAGFTDKGGRVSVTLALDADHQAVLTVKDTGMGLEPEVLASLLEPFGGFGALPGARARLGLSLALVKGLAVLHGGSLEAQSDGPGRGTAFTLRLPLAPAQAPAPPAPPRLVAATRARRILIVEDLSDAAITMELLLEMLGHTVESAPDGASGLEKALRFQPQVILCDIGLPGQMDGYGLARSVRAAPALADVHLIALTGFNAQEDKDLARQAGFDLHLTKPVDPASLEATLARYGSVAV